MPQQLCVKETEANEAVPVNRLLGFLIIAAALLVSCSYPERDDLIGSYFLETPFGEETFVLHANGTFDQTLIVYEFADTVSYRGSWGYREESGCAWMNGGLLLIEECGLNSDYRTPVASNVRVMSCVKWLRFPGTAMRLSAGCEGEFYVKRD